MTATKSLRIAITFGALNHRCGPSVASIRLTRALREQGLGVSLLHRTPVETAEESLLDEFPDILLPIPPWHPFHPAVSLSFARHVRRHRFDTVLFNAVRTYSVVLAPWAKWLGASTVYWMGNVLEYSSGWLQRLTKYTGPRYIDRFVAVSHAVADNIRQHNLAGSDEVTVIYRGVESVAVAQQQSWRSELRQELGLTRDETVFVTCGRLASDKRQIHLLEACNKLKEAGYRFRMLVVGDGSARADLEEYCKRTGLNENVIFVGWQPEVYPYLATGDVFLFHSTARAEGLPQVVTEAAMNGLPLILADIPCLREVYGPDDAALFAGVGNPAEFAAHMQLCLRNSEIRAAMGRKAKAKAEKDFSVGVMMQRYLDVVRELCSQPR